ncbi:tyrosinase precursor [Fusarium albosuccineum]|uniref:tyrosinase n=1 Tax=Fusarium albosuccineum TaxID=1237068 RepID=A0A8H4LAM5_9HYPO|nr:tyrosinase precursor [Fusarium albosuccineum]
MRGILLFVRLYGIFFFFLLATAQEYDYGVDVVRMARRADLDSPVVVKQLPVSRNGTVPLRPEIREMKADPYRWDLYILALSMLQHASQDDPTSWYQIAGIHGVPFEPWNGVEPLPGANESGYCTHSSVLFPTWHRPYLALFEQQLFDLAHSIAVLFPNDTERQAYENAAREFRMPYWDWAMAAPEGEDHFPGVFWNATIAQYGPRGVQIVTNPLYSYKFHPKNEDAFIWSPLKRWDETKRAPDTAVSDISPPSNNDQVNAALLSRLPQIQQRLFILFSSYKDFNNFGNKAWAVAQNLSTMDSIESIHDIVHIYGGLKGHMTYVPLSSFDPLFLLHHTMTDRLVAMWQILNPDSWMAPMAAGETSFTTIKGDIQDSKTPLTPFFASENGTFWNSDMARTTEAFGYSYADTSASGKQGQNLREELIKKISKWYGGSSLIGLRAQKWQARHQSPKIMHIKSRGEHFAGARPNVRIDAKDPPISWVLKDGRYTEWIANVRVNVEALDGNFGIHFFLGKPPRDCNQWNFASNLAGTVAIFAMNRQTGSETMISGTAPLTSALMKMVAAGEILHLGPGVVVPFLRETLQFRVLGSNGEEVDASEVAGLYIGISSSEVRAPETETVLPEWGEMTERIQVWA